MTCLVLDVENTITVRDKRKFLDPFEPDNKLVLVGTLNPANTDSDIFNFGHNDHSKVVHKPEDLQIQLDNAEYLVGHHIVHDLLWLWACGFKYDGPVWDTMVAEHVLLKGVKKPLNLGACGERHQLSVIKDTFMSDQLKAGVSVADMQYDELVRYLKGDLVSTGQLMDSQKRLLELPENQSLKRVISLSNKVTLCIARIAYNGFAVDKDALENIKEEYHNEYTENQEFLQRMAQEVMGDTPVNLASPLQLSSLLYSRKPTNRMVWASLFEPRMSDTEYRKLRDANTEIIFRTRAVRCQNCHGKGKIRKVRKDGTFFKNETKCPICSGEGVRYVETNEKAGLGFIPPTKSWVTANGFSTDATTLTTLMHIAQRAGKEQSLRFLQALQRNNAVSTYLSTFVGGIERNCKKDGLLHVNLNQTTTSTARFSSSDPNMQNMPRFGTFPIKRAFTSRFKGGVVADLDFAQLEFRIAAFLSQDVLAIHEIETGFDVHSHTSKVITEAGEQTNRQQAKPHTFAPLYGATGFGRSPAVAAYYKHFIEKYKGIAAWHSQLAREALNVGTITTPSGRQYDFSHVIRKANGDPTHFTQIKNYPVQGFATGDIVPLVLVYLQDYMDTHNMQSYIVNSVHDSIVLDVHPDDITSIPQVLADINADLQSLIDEEWDLDFNVPLLVEGKIGKNWLDMEDIL